MFGVLACSELSNVFTGLAREAVMALKQQSSVPGRFLGFSFGVIDPWAKAVPKNKKTHE